MDWVNISFWVFSIVAGISAAAVISVRNPVYAVLCLILTFFSVACIWILVGAEFLGVALVVQARGTGCPRAWRGLGLPRP